MPMIALLNIFGLFLEVRNYCTEHADGAFGYAPQIHQTYEKSL